MWSVVVVLAAGGLVIGAGVLLQHAEAVQFGLEAVAAAGAAQAATGQAGGEHHAVVGERGGRDPVCGNGFAELGDHDRTGDPVVGGDTQGVAGVVVEPGQDLGVCSRSAIGPGEPVVGEVGLPALVRLFGGEADVGGPRSLLRLRGHQPGGREATCDRGPRDGHPVVMLQVPADGLRARIQPSCGQLLPQFDDQVDGFGRGRIG